jgi:hypothetical protein
MRFGVGHRDDAFRSNGFARHAGCGLRRAADRPGVANHRRSNATTTPGGMPPAGVSFPPNAAATANTEMTLPRAICSLLWNDSITPQAREAHAGLATTRYGGALERSRRYARVVPELVRADIAHDRRSQRSTLVIALVRPASYPYPTSRLGARDEAPPVPE